MLACGWHPFCTAAISPHLSACRMAQGSRFIQPEGYKQRVKDKFAERAVSYDDDLSFHAKVAQRVTEAGALREGDSVLDVACGTGLVALAAAHLVGPSGRVVGIDISEQMIAQAMAKAEQLNLRNVEFVIADVEEHSFPDGSFDAILSASAVPYLQHVSSTFGSFCRWLKTGGRLAFNAPQSPMFEATDTLNRLVSEGFGIVLVDASGEVGNPQEVDKLLRAAGFADVKVNLNPDLYIIRNTTPAAFAERMWQLSSTFPMSPLNLALSPEQIESLRSAYLPEVAQQGKALQVGSDIVNEFTDLVVIATA